MGPEQAKVLTEQYLTQKKQEIMRSRRSTYEESILIKNLEKLQIMQGGVNNFLALGNEETG